MERKAEEALRRYFGVRSEETPAEWGIGDEVEVIDPAAYEGLKGQVVGIVRNVHDEIINYAVRFLTGGGGVERNFKHEVLRRWQSRI